MDDAALCMPDGREPTYRINKVHVSLLSPEVADRLAQVPMTSTRMIWTNSSSQNSKKIGPHDDGVLSLKSGPYTSGWKCSTCMKDSTECLGHMGVIHFPFPIFLHQFVPYIVKTLRLVCYACSALTNGAKTCPSCSKIQPKTIKKTATVHIDFVWDKPKKGCEDLVPTVLKQQLSALEVLDILSGINDGDWRNVLCKEVTGETCGTEGVPLYFTTHPSMFIVSKLLVTPPPTRVSCVGDNGCSHSDLTTLFQNILSSAEDAWSEAEKWYNTKDFDAAFSRQLWSAADPETHLEFFKSTPAFVLKMEKICMFHSGLISNANSVKVGGKKAQSRVWRNFSVLYGGKKGYVRSQCGGGRTTDSGRAVAAQNCFMDLDECTLPDDFASMTTREYCVDFNRRLWDGPDSEFSRTARYVRYPDRPSMIDVEYLRNNGKTIPPLCVGCVIERPLKKGDWALMHRLPTLDSGSFWALKLSRTPRPPVQKQNVNCDEWDRCHVAEIPLTICAPLNCDFDGDELNTHRPRLLQAQSEIREMFASTQNLLQPASGRPYMSIIQDAAVGCYGLVNSHLTFDFATATDMLFQTCKWFRPLNFGLLYTGADIFSTLLNEHLCVPGIVRDGVLLTNNLKRKTLSTIYFTTIKDFGGEVAVNFLTSAFRLGLHFTTSFGLSLDPLCCMPPRDKLDELRGRTDYVCKLIDDSFQRLFKGGYSEKDQIELESDAQKLLNGVTMEAAKIVEDHCAVESKRKPMRDPIMCVTSGSKGSMNNLGNVYAQAGMHTTGQLHLNDSDFRPASFGPHSFHPQSWGFGSHSLTHGLTHSELMHYFAFARRSLVIQAKGTGQAGYMKRKLDFHTSLFKTAWDFGTYEGNDHKQLIQECYGGDGLRPELIEMEKLPCVCKSEEPSGWKEFVARAYERNRVPYCFCKGAEVPVPVSVERLVLSNKRYGPPNGRVVRLRYLVQSLVDFERRMKRSFRPVYRSRWMVVAVWCHCRPSTLCNNWHESQLDALLNDVYDRFNRAFVIPETTVGLVASAAIGQPLSQKLLDATHSVGSKEGEDGPNLFDTLFAITHVRKKQPGATISARLLNPGMNVQSLVTIRMSDVMQYTTDFSTANHPLRETEIRVMEQVWGYSVDNTWCVRVTLRTGISLSIYEICSKLSCASKLVAMFPFKRTISLFFETEDDAGVFVQKLPAWRLAGVAGVVAASTFESGTWVKLVMPATALGSLVDVVDIRTVKITHVVDTEKLFGVIAAKFVGTRHLDDVFAMSNVQIHTRHLATLMDISSRSGSLASFNRTGLHNVDAFLLRSTFEQILTTLFKSGVRCQTDPLENIVSQMLTGGEASKMSEILCQKEDVYSKEMSIDVNDENFLSVNGMCSPLIYDDYNNDQGLHSPRVILPEVSSTNMHF